MARCLSCNSVITHLNRNIGGGALVPLSQSRVNKFFANCRAKREEQGDKISYHQVRSCLSDQLTDQEVTSTSQEVSGEYLPLAVWANKGFDTEKIKQFNRTKFNPACGLCYQCPLYSENWRNTQSTINESLARAENAFKKRKGRNPLQDEIEDDPPTKKARTGGDERKGDSDGSEAAEDAEEECEEEEEDDASDDADKKSSKPAAFLPDNLQAALLEALKGVLGSSAASSKAASSQAADEDKAAAKAEKDAAKEAAKVERAAKKAEASQLKKEAAADLKEAKKIVAFSGKVEALLKPKWDEDQNMMKRLGDMAPMQMTRDFEAMQGRGIPKVT